MSLFAVIVLGLATWRLSHMLALEDGPGQVFSWVRTHLGVQESVGGTYRYSEHMFGQLILCPLCLSVWVALLFVGLWILLPTLQILVVIFAVSGISSAVELGLRK